jgi:uncharacterized phage infection (PIP) family protein YhgE
MKTFFSRLVGVLLVVASFAGIILGIAGIFIIWNEEGSISAQVGDSLVLLDQTLDTTQDGLSILGSTLENASSQVDAIQDTTATTADTLATTTPILDSLANLFGTKLIDVVTDTQLSLAAAEASATLIDDTLSVISSIPIIGTRYEPGTSLATSMDQISESLGELPSSFNEIEQNLTSTSANLGEVQNDIEDLYASLGDISQNLQDAQAVIQEYQEITIDLQAKVDQFQQNFPGRLARLAWGITFILAWVAIASLGLFTQGLELLRNKK